MKLIDADKLRAEIERRLQRENEILWNAKLRGTYPSPSCEYNLLTLTSLRDFLDTLSEEEPVPKGYDEAYLNEKIAKASKTWEGVDVDKYMDEVRGREPDKSLEEEVKRYYSDNFVYISSDQPTLSILTNIARHFAEWGADHFRGVTQMVDKSLEEAADEWYEKCPAPKSTWWDEGEEMKLTDSKETFIAGAQWQKQQMLKDAAEGEVRILPGCAAYVLAKDERDNNTLEQYIVDNFKAGDKVKIVIVRED